MPFDSGTKFRGYEDWRKSQDPDYIRNKEREATFGAGQGKEWRPEQLGPPEPPNSVGTKGIAAYRKWREEQIAQGYTFKVDWERGKNYQPFTPYKKRYWEKNPLEGKYNGELEMYNDIANKINSDELPPGAVGYTGNGDVYYGGKNDFDEWKRRYEANMKVGDYTKAGEQGLADWDAPNIQQAYQQGGWKGAAVALFKGAVEGVDQFNEWVGWKMQGGEEGVTPGLQAWREAVYTAKKPVMWAFSIAQESERFFAGLKNVDNFIKDVPTFDDYDPVEGQRLRLLGDKDWLMKATKTEEKPITWKNIVDEYYEGAKYGDILYSVMWEDLISGQYGKATGPGSMRLEEYRRELMADPSLEPQQIKDKYENFWVEMIGEALIDPLNIVDVAVAPLMKNRQLANTMYRWASHGIEYLDETAEASSRAGRIVRGVKETILGKEVKQNLKFVDEAVQSAEKMAVMVDKRAQQVKRVGAGMEELANSKGIFQYTNGAKASELAYEVDEVSQWAINAAKSGGKKFEMDNYLDIMDLVAKSVSDDPQVRRRAFAELSKLPGWDVVITDPGTRAAMVLEQMGKGKWMSKIKKAEKVEDAFKVMDEILEATTKKFFPTMAEQIEKGVDLGTGWKAISRFHEATRPVYNAVNGMMSFVYMGLSPGFASRNFLQNNIQAIIDEGFGYASQLFKVGVEDGVRKWAGVDDIGKLVGMKGGLGPARDLAGQNKKGTINWLSRNAPMSKLSAAAEDMTSVKIYGKVYPETMKKILGRDRIVQDLVQQGLSKGQAQEIYKTLMKNKGDAVLTMSEIIADAKQGFRRARNIDLDLGDDAIKFLEETKLIDHYHEILRTSATKEDAMRTWDNLWKEYMDWAEQGVLDAVPVLDEQIGPIGEVIQDALSKGADRATGRALVEHVMLNGEATREFAQVGKNLEDYFVDIFAKEMRIQPATARRRIRDFMNTRLPVDVGGEKIGMYDALFDGKYGNIIYQESRNTFNKWDNVRNLIMQNRDDPVELKNMWNNLFASKYGSWVDGTSPEKLIDKAWRMYDDETRKVWGMFRDDYAAQMKEGFTKLQDFIEANIGKKLPSQKNKWSLATKKLQRAKKYDRFAHRNTIRFDLNRAIRNKDMTAAINLWANQYRIKLTGWQGGQSAPIFTKFGEKIDDVLDMKPEEIDELVDMLIRANKRDSAKELSNAYYARKTIMEQGAGSAEDITTQAISDADQVAKNVQAVQENVRKADEALQLAGSRTKADLEALEEAVRRETGGTLYNNNDYLVRILNSQLGRDFKSMADVTVDSLTWKEAEGALLAHALGERLHVFSEPDRGWGLVKRFMFDADVVGYSDGQIKQIDDLLVGLRDLEPKLVDDIYRIKGQWDSATARLTNSTAPDIADKQKEVDELAELLQKRLDDAEVILRGQEPESLARRVTNLQGHIPERTGSETSWSGITNMTEQRAIWEQREHLGPMKDKVRKAIEDNWDKTKEFKASKEELNRMKAAQKYLENEVLQARRVSNEVARATRNFVLHDYHAKRNGDLIAGYLMPYSFWYSRTYSKYLARAVTKPGTMQAYATYKKKMAELHHDMPDWWKYQLSTNEMGKGVQRVMNYLGVDPEHPLFFNLEATLMPLNGITGVDFDDPRKRTNWFNSAIDKAGKFGPSIYTPITMAIALDFYRKGELELAEKWGGRLIPQSRFVKAVTAGFGANQGAGVEIDPMVKLLSDDDLDYYERKRVGRALAWAVQNGEISQEEAFDAARERSGPIYQNAKAIAQSDRMAGNVSSFFLGVGFKGRNAEDIEIQKMDDEYSKFLEIKDQLAPEEVFEAYDYFRAKYPFFDTVKLSRRDVKERDTSYAYSVLARIPPSMSADIYEALGIEYEDVKAFKEAKGIPSTWKDSQQAKFAEAMIELGAILSVPDTATKQEWREVYDRTEIMREYLADKYGEGITDLESHYWDIYSKDGWEKAQEFVAENPVLQEYMNEKTSYQLKDPLLRTYYGSYSKARSMLRSRREYELNERFPGIQGKIDQYYEIKLADGKAAKAFLKENPDIEAYWDAKAITEQATNELLLSYETWLPEADELAQPEFRQDETAMAEMTQERSEIIDRMQKTDTRPEYLDWSYDQWLGQFNPTLQRMVQDWVQGGEMLSYNAEKQMQYSLPDGIDYEMAKLLIFRAGRGYQTPPPK